MRIRAIDIETTGNFPPEHGVVEIGRCDVIERPCGWKVLTPQSYLVDPQRSFPPETCAVHHIIAEDVIGAPKWDEIAEAVLFGNAESIDCFAAHSAKFERRFITDELARGIQWIDSYKCGLRLWPESPIHSNQGLRYFRNPIGLVRALATPAHRAGPDAYVTAFHVRDLLELASVEDLIKWSSEPALQVTCHIGRQRGMKWRDVDIGFLYWLLDKDFDEDVLFTARFEIERREREHPAPVEEEDVDQDEDA